MMSTSAGSTKRMLAGAALAALAVGTIAILFVIIWLAFPSLNGRFYGLLLMGFIALLASGGSWFAQALSADPTYQRAAAWGLFAMGYAILFLTVAFYPNDDWGIIVRLVAILFLVVFLAVVGGLAFWMMTSRMGEQVRLERRQAWDQQPPPSAFSYASARQAAPPVAPPPSTDSPAPPAKGA